MLCRMARAQRSKQTSRSGGAARGGPPVRAVPLGQRATTSRDGARGRGPSVRLRPGATPAMVPWRGEPTSHASPSLGWGTSEERLCTVRVPGAACFGSAQSKGYAMATAPGVPSTCAAEGRGVMPAAGMRKSHCERGASHFGRKRTERGLSLSRLDHGLPRGRRTRHDGGHSRGPAPDRGRPPFRGGFGL